MNARPGLRLYFDTVRYLRPVQVYGRLWFRLARPVPDLSAAPALRALEGHWVQPARRRHSLFAPALFCLLNVEGNLDQCGWDDPATDKLWRYNLHYFDDLNAAGAEQRTQWHRTLIARWIAENPPGTGTGWEPYPISLRIVNWIKWALAGNSLSEDAKASLAVQARWLSKRLEYHLLGNHLFANAKALVFAGLSFEGPEAESWLERGLGIMAREIPEQILPDGGHFELSPMYHALALEDMLDLVNIARMYSGAVPVSRHALVQNIEGSTHSMRRWLASMCHPDSEIGFFNDAAVGLAPGEAELQAYAGRLGLPPIIKNNSAVTRLNESGYIRLQVGRAVALLDVGRIGPDYLPGHAHADTLSFELSLGKQRVLVNSGTSMYGTGPERLRQRGTAAHNTVVVDGENSSEVWSGFRVARRARPKKLELREDAALTVACEHDGYRRLLGRPVHRRLWSMDEGGIRVADTVSGGTHPAEARFYFHPAVIVARGEDRSTGTAAAGDAGRVQWTVETGRARLEEATWHPEFGLSRQSKCLVVALKDGASAVSFRWGCS